MRAKMRDRLNAVDTRQAPFRAYANDGKGKFVEATESMFPKTAVGNGFDVEAADVNGDGRPDLYLANRWGADILLIKNK